MDALRASTMLLLIPVHAVTLLSLNGHGGAWAVAVFWFIHVFRLPLFFAMSGFFLTLLISRKGLRETVRNRTMRIVIPLVVCLLTLVPLMVLASQATGTVVASDGRLTHGNPITFQPAFLWFLWYLLIFDAVAFALHALFPSLLRRAGAAMRAAIAHPLLGIALLAVPTALALWSQPNWTEAPPGSWAPQISVLAYYAPFFALGATLCAHRELVGNIASNAWKWTACAVAATVPAAALFTLHDSPRYADRLEVHGAALVIYAVATWASLLALVGLADRYLNRPSPRLRYLADSSYWLYLSHLPAMVLIMAFGTAIAVGTAPQFALATIGSLAVSLASYALFVRYTPIGWVLNGPRRRPPGRRSATSTRPILTASAGPG
jgi:peptidoglycan/LPS O-acetylase OafA/YrhL